MSSVDEELQPVSVSDPSSSRRPRNYRSKTLTARAEADNLRGQVAQLAATRAEADNLRRQVTRLTAEVQELRCQNTLLTFQLGESRSGVSTLLRHIPGDQASAPAVAVPVHGLDAAAGAWHQPQEGRASVFHRLDLFAGQSLARSRGTRPGNSSPSSQARRAGPGRGQGSSPSAPEQASQDRSTGPSHGRGDPRGRAHRRY